MPEHIIGRIRPARVEDAARISALSCLVWKHRNPNAEQYAGDMRYDTDSSTRLLWVYEADGSVQGFINVYYNKFNKKALVTEIAVSDKLQRQGIGRALFAVMMRHMLSISMEYIQIQANSPYSARIAYQFGLTCDKPDDDGTGHYDAYFIEYPKKVTLETLLSDMPLIEKALRCPDNTVRDDMIRILVRDLPIKEVKVSDIAGNDTYPELGHWFYLSSDNEVLRFSPFIGNTTRDLINAVKEEIDEGECVIDAGCGTGIQAIMALKHGASRAVCIDKRPLALVLTLLNAESAGVPNKLTVQCVDILNLKDWDPGYRFDRVIYNSPVPVRSRLVEATESGEVSDEIMDPGGRILAGLLKGVKHLLKPDSVINMESGDSSFVRRIIAEQGFRIDKSVPLMGDHMTYSLRMKHERPISVNGARYQPMPDKTTESVCKIEEEYNVPDITIEQRSYRLEDMSWPHESTIFPILEIKINREIYRIGREYYVIITLADGKKIYWSGQHNFSYSFFFGHYKENAQALIDKGGVLWRCLDSHTDFGPYADMALTPKKGVDWQDEVKFGCRLSFGEFLGYLKYAGVIRKLFRVEFRSQETVMNSATAVPVEYAGIDAWKGRRIKGGVADIDIDVVVGDDPRISKSDARAKLARSMPEVVTMAMDSDVCFLTNSSEQSDRGIPYHISPDIAAACSVDLVSALAAAAVSGTGAREETGVEAAAGTAGYFSQPVDELITELQEERTQLLGLQLRWEPAIAVFGSARIPETHPFYEVNRRFGATLFGSGLCVRSGAGPSMMDAPLRGYIEAREEARARAEDGPAISRKTQGIRITLPFEQKTTAYAEEVYVFKHFVTRKLGLYENCLGTVVFPGGFGTMDEFFEVWLRGEPVVLIGKSYWQPIMDALLSAWPRENLMAKIPSVPHITNSLDDAMEYLERNRRKILKSDATAVSLANEEIARNLRALSAWEPGIAIMGEPGEGSPTLETAKGIMARLSASRIPVKAGSRGVLLDTLIDYSRETHTADT
ncbi:MAG: GNAT family N-acetyltransferase, partial [Candidatus Omnitrophota bacterium]